MMIFPREIWTKIFHELDRFTIREIASLVCKEWLNIVRNDFKLSSEIIVNSKEKLCIKASEINSLLLSYPMLKTLHIFLQENEDILEELNFEPCIYLTKVVVNGNFNDQMGFRGEWEHLRQIQRSTMYPNAKKKKFDYEFCFPVDVTQIVFNPKEKLELNTENVYQLDMNFSDISSKSDSIPDLNRLRDCCPQLSNLSMTFGKLDDDPLNGYSGDESCEII